MTGRPLTVLYVMGQTAQRANGGVASLLLIASGLRDASALVMTNRRSAAVDRAEARGVELVIEPELEFDWGSRTRPSETRRRLAWVQRVAAVNARIAKLIRKHRIDVIHANDVAALYLSAIAARAAGVPVVWNIRDLTNVKGLKWRAGRVLADVVVTLSEDMSARVRSALPRIPGGPTAPVTNIYSVVDTERIAPLGSAQRLELRRSLGIGDSEVAVGLVAAFMERKRQLELLRALSKQTNCAGTVWYFVGDYDPERERYAAEFRALLERTPGLKDRVRTVGFRDDVDRWYQALDLVVVASKEEGLARCMIEGISAGTPVVSFDVPSAREILEGHRCGLVVRGGDFDALLAGVEQLAKDPAGRRELGERGRATAVELFSGTRNVERYEALYRRLVDARPRRQRVKRER